MSLSNQVLSPIPKKQSELDKLYMPSSKKREDNYFENLSFLALKSAPLSIKLFMGASILSASAATAALLDDKPETTVLSIGFGLAAYAVMSFAKSNDAKGLMSLESTNIMSEVGKYDTRTWDPSKRFGHLTIREYVGRTARGTKLSLASMLNKTALAMPSLYNRYAKGVIQKEDVGRAMFLYQVLSDLDNDTSPQAMFIKSQKVFQRDEVRAILADSKKFANIVESQKLSTKELGAQVYKALGEDAHLVVKDVSDNFQGKREFMGLELEVYKDAMKAMHVNIVHEEMSYRMLTFLGQMEDPKDFTLYLQNRRNETLDRMRVFTKDEFKNAPYSKLEFREMVRKADDFIKLFEMDLPSWDLQENVKIQKEKLGIEDVPLDRINHSHNQRDKELLSQRIVGYLLSNGEKKEYDEKRSFHRCFIDSLLSKVSNEIRVRANKDFDEDNLAGLTEAQVTDLKEIYGVKQLSDISPKSVTAAVTERVKARLYYGINKEKVDKDFSFEQSMGM